MPPKAVDAAEALHPEPALSRPWAAPTKAWSTPGAGGAPTAPVGGGHAPESGRCCGGDSPGTGAFAAMGRSYKSVAHFHRGWRIHRPCRRGPCPRKRWMLRRRFTRNRRFRGHGPLLQKHGPLPARVVHPRGIYKGTSPCWYDLRPSRRGPPAREAAMGRSYKNATHLQKTRPTATPDTASTGEYTLPRLRIPTDHCPPCHRKEILHAPPLTIGTILA
jgi:hypothetical protein